jgi:hypothetical protein
MFFCGIVLICCVAVADVPNAFYVTDLGADAWATGINVNGQVTGYAGGNGIDWQGAPRAVQYSGGVNGTYTDLGTPVDPRIQYQSSPESPWIWNQGNGIAANGDIVGSMGFQNEGPYIPDGQHGFIYSDSAGTVTDLNTPLDSSAPANWVITSATAIATITYPGHAGTDAR